jgi:hypothetical protein
VVGVRGFEPPHTPRNLRIIRSARSAKMSTRFKLVVDRQFYSIGGVVRGAR